MKIVIAATLALAVCAASAASEAGACEADHWITSIADYGEIITLEDHTIWEVDGSDIVDSTLWMAMDDVVVCDDKIVNTDENETVGAHQLH